MAEDIFWRNPDSPSLRSGILRCGSFVRKAGYGTRRAEGSGDWLLIYTVAGAGRIVAADGSHMHTASGDALLYAPRDFQDYSTAPAPPSQPEAVPTWQLQWAHFMPRPHWSPWLRWPLSDKGLRLQRLEEGEARQEFARAMTRMVHFSRRPLPAAQEFAANALERALLWVIADVSRRGMDSRVQEAVEYLAANATLPFHMQALAKQCGLSVSRLSLLFRQHTGTTPQQFHEQQRLNQAAQLLRLTSLSIAEIAADVGYDDPFYFSNRFYKLYNQRPTAYRNGGKAAE
ncbi:hypothetical protein DB346_17330 [Verrucomicrobia bacterium LW23]|nr:hypothetical protein DB346_17330 [Verrucomicrobia bacterium LW23]